MIIKQALKLATAELSAHGLKLPRLEAEILLSWVLKKPREFLLAHAERQLTPKQISNFKFPAALRACQPLTLPATKNSMAWIFLSIRMF